MTSQFEFISQAGVNYLDDLIIKERLVIQYEIVFAHDHFVFVYN